MSEKIEEIIQSPENNNLDTQKEVSTEISADTTPSDDGDVMAQFEAAKAGVNKSEVKQKVEEQGKKIASDTTSTEEITKKPVETPANNVVQKTQEQQVQSNPRVEVLKSLGIPEDQHKNYQRMSNEAFETVKNVLTESKQLKENLTNVQSQLKVIQENPNRLPDNYYANPNAYLLDPDYNNLQRGLSTAQAIKNHYIGVLKAISKGENWRDLQADDKGNVFVIEEDLEPSEEARIAAEDQIRQASDWLFGNQKRIQELQNTFKGRFENDVNLIKEQESRFFPDYDKPDHWSASIQKQLIELLPASQRNQPLARTLAKTVANNSRFANENKTLKEELAKIKLELETFKKKSTQPTKGQFQNNSGTTNTNDEVTMEDFMRARGR
jgi:hypothetical protein